MVPDRLSTTLKVSFDISTVKAQGHDLLLPVFLHSATPQAHQSSKKGLYETILGKAAACNCMVSHPAAPAGRNASWGGESQNIPCSLGQWMQHPLSVSKGTGSFSPWRDTFLSAGQIPQTHWMQKQFFAIPSKEKRWPYETITTRRAAVEKMPKFISTLFPSSTRILSRLQSLLIYTTEIAFKITLLYCCAFRTVARSWELQHNSPSLQKARMTSSAKSQLTS